jgi:hypothetical protein
VVAHFRCTHRSVSKTSAPVPTVSVMEPLLLCNFATLQLCNFATLQLCNFATLQLCNFATLQLCNFATLQLCNFATLQLCNFATLQLCNFATLQLCNFGNFATLQKSFTHFNQCKGIQNSHSLVGPFGAFSYFSVKRDSILLC